jgi:peptide/nickel transport system permease protein
MAEDFLSSQPGNDLLPHPRRAYHSILRVALFALKRAFSLFIIVIIGVYLTILITNKAVVLDKIDEPNPSPITGWMTGIWNPAISYRSPGREAPTSFFEQSLRLLVHGITLNLGETRARWYMGSSQIDSVSQIILDSLPRTLVLFGAANLLVFVSSVSLALVISRRFGNWLDRLVLGLSPFSAIPPWFYGVIITVFMVKTLQIYPGKMWDSWPEEFTWDYLPFVLKHFIPPVLALFFSKFLQSVIAWRSFMLAFSSEDYIELAKAKGLPAGLVERRYLLRPVMPYIITSFSLLLIGIWQEAIVVELFFSTAGIGHLFYNAIRYHDMPLIVGLTVTFAYFLAISVFILEFIYALIDPRVDVTKDKNGGQVVSGRRPNLFRIMAGRKTEKSLWKNRLEERRLAASAYQDPVRRIPDNQVDAARRLSFSSILEGARRFMGSLKVYTHYKSALFGATIILILILVSIYTLITIPYSEAIQRWNYDRGQLWSRNPVKAGPVWTNLFRWDPLPKSIYMTDQDQGVTRTVTELSPEMTEIALIFPFDFPYRGFTQEIALTMKPTYAKKLPFVSLVWVTPDGREINGGDFVLQRPERHIFSRDAKLTRRLGNQNPVQGLFADPDVEGLKALPGKYELRVYTLVFEDVSDIEVEFMIYGQVHGWAGTDHRRRDLSTPMLWGAPIALAFGFLGAIGTSLVTMLIAAAGAWFRGWTDGLVQRLTEVNMILPVFPILLIVYGFYTKSIWAILGVAILLGIFGSSIKTYRSIFLQLREAPYVEAAQIYGTSNTRIIFLYLIPRILSVLIPQFIILVPSYVYLEATLAYLNMSDPLMPTWGKVIREALTNGGLEGAYHWAGLPVGVLFLTGFGFLLVGYSLERVLNPRLRDM